MLSGGASLDAKISKLRLHLSLNIVDVAEQSYCGIVLNVLIVSITIYLAMYECNSRRIGEDVVEEDEYRCCKEDIVQDFPGKEKALFQVREKGRGGRA